jgi:putative ABC transport system permease protein
MNPFHSFHLFNPFPVVSAGLRRNRPLALTTLVLVALALACGIAVVSQERALRQGSARAAPGPPTTSTS